MNCKLQDPSAKQFLTCIILGSCKSLPSVSISSAVFHLTLLTQVCDQPGFLSRLLWLVWVGPNVALVSLRVFKVRSLKDDQRFLLGGLEFKGSKVSVHSKVGQRLRELQGN